MVRHRHDISSSLPLGGHASVTSCMAIHCVASLCRTRVQVLDPPQAVGPSRAASPRSDRSTERCWRRCRALHYATDGEPRWWVLPTKLNEVTKEAIALAVDRGW